MSQRIIAIIEGESLVNDATALVAFAFAVEALKEVEDLFAVLGFESDAVVRENQLMEMAGACGRNFYNGLYV